MANITAAEHPKLVLEMTAMERTTPAHYDEWNVRHQQLLDNDKYLNEQFINVFSDSAAAHNSIYRGKNLTNVYTVDEICQRISAGTFKDLYVGDYFDISITTDLGGAETVRCILAGFDVFWNNGDTAFTKHHAVIVPKDCFKTKSVMNATNENVIIQWRGKTVEEPYIIEVSKNKQDGYRKVGHIYVDTRNHNICSTYIHDLKPGSSYYVRIYSVDSSGKKKYSEPLEVVTEPEGKIENLKYEWKKSNSVKLSWDKVSGANVYKVRYYKDNDEYIKYTTKNSLTLKNLKKGEGYSTRVEPMRQSESGFHVESNNAGEGKIYIE